MDFILHLSFLSHKIHVLINVNINHYLVLKSVACECILHKEFTVMLPCRGSSFQAVPLIHFMSLPTYPHNAGFSGYRLYKLEKIPSAENA